MKLSILLITYNQEKFIRQCIEGILLQEIPFEYEVIVADDLSCDTTLSIIQDLLINKVNNLRILNTNKNLGISKNYHKGFSACKGEYVAVMEGDDYWTDPKRLQKHIDFLDNNRECVMSMNRFTVYDQDLQKTSVREWDSAESYQYITTRQMATRNHLGNLSACVFRKNAIDKVRPDLFEIEIADWMIGLVLSKYGFIAILKEIMSVYRVHGNGKWSKMSVEKKIQKTILLIDKYDHYLGYQYQSEFKIYKEKLKASLRNETPVFQITSFFKRKIRKIFSPKSS